ncbi:MAG: helix-turn-helix domain-containing protein [Planctomycetota bacterium]|nr:MAG: helix-turn-helix domain-containing protein [Planctomycetota bacterium]
MDKAKKKTLEKAGWKLGSAAEFLAMSPEEEVLLEIRLALAQAVKDRRKRKRLTQAEFAKCVSSSQSRVAKMEAGSPTVSLDLLLKALTAMGASRAEVAKAIRSKVA